MSFHGNFNHKDIHYFPTRRSSDLFHPPSDTRPADLPWLAEIPAGRFCGPTRRCARRLPGPAQTLFAGADRAPGPRSEEHTSELQSHVNLVCRLLLEKKKLQEQGYG